MPGARSCVAATCRRARGAWCCHFSSASAALRSKTLTCAISLETATAMATTPRMTARMASFFIATVSFRFVGFLRVGSARLLVARLLLVGGFDVRLRVVEALVHSLLSHVVVATLLHAPDVLADLLLLFGRDLSGQKLPEVHRVLQSSHQSD